jgi:predicted TIM-barrel fold metal-dependent hydrolase
MNRRDFLSQAGLAAILAATPDVVPARAADMPAPGSSTSDESFAADEPAIDPDLPIVDAHRHMHDNPAMHDRRLLQDIVAMIGGSGHNVTHTVFMESHAMFPLGVPEMMQPVGDIEFANGQAAMSASGSYGPCRVNAALIGHADMRFGDAIKGLLEAEIRAGNGRLRGVRYITNATDKDYTDRPHTGHAEYRQSLMDPKVRAGIAHCEPLGLIYHNFCFHTQLLELASVADAFPNTSIVLDHMGGPFDLIPTWVVQSGKREEFFKIWSRDIGALAKRPNVSVKVGCLAMDYGLPAGTNLRLSSQQMADIWRPCIERSIEAFGVDRCMFENDGGSDKLRSICSYGVGWNTFKRVTANYSAAEKAALFGGTAKRIYRLA